MIEINFFERKKRNYSPLILLAIFLVGLVLIGGYVILMNGTLQNEHDNNQAKITQQRPIVEELRQIQLYGSQVRELTDQVEQLQENQYPTPFVYETIVGLLPASEVLYLNDYAFSINDSLRLSVQLEGLDQVIDLQRSLLELAFVTDIELDTVDLISQENDHYIVNVRAVIDRDRLSEVTQND